MSLETKPQTKKPELVSSQAQSLTKKYQETKELLQLQELKKRNMQAQLGLSLSHLCTKEPYLSDTKKPSTSEILSSSLVTKPVTFVLLDSEGKIRELEELLDCSKPLSVKELTKLLHCHTDSVLPEFPQDANEHDSDITKCQKLLESLKNQQDMENETMRKSLAKAGDSIRDYEARLITMEDMLGRVQKTPHISPCLQDDLAQMTNRGLSQRFELLASENEALNQRYQEIVNQLREADREIDRLKAELQSGQQNQPVRVSQDATVSGGKDVLKNLYEQELLDKSQKLEEALINLEVLGNSLKDTEKKLQLKEATLKGLGFQVPDNGKDNDSSDLEKEHLRQCIEVLESKLSEKEKLLQTVEQGCRELQAQNTELQMKKQESEQTFSHALLEAKEDIRKLKERAVEGVESHRVDSKCRELMQHDGGEMEEVLEGFKERSDALHQVLAMLMKSSENECDGSRIGFEEGHAGRNLTGRVMALFDREILGRVLSGIENSQVGKEECEQAAVVKSVAERMLVENKILISMIRNEESSINAEHAEVQTDIDAVGDEKINDAIVKQLVQTLRSKVNLLNQIASTVNEPANEQVKSLTVSGGVLQTQWSRCIRDAILDVTRTYFLLRQRFQTDSEMHPEAEATPAACNCCSQLKEQNLELQLQLDQMATQMSSPQNPIAEDSKLMTHIHIEGEPIDSLDKEIQLQDLVAKHKKELREVRETYEREAATLKEEVSKTEETLRLRSEENVKEIDSLTVCMENLKEKHELERNTLVEHFNQDLAELNDVMGSFRADLPDDGQLSTASLKQCIRRLVAQVSQETKRRDREEDATLLRLKYEKDLENLKVVVFLVLSVLFPPVMACVPLWQLPTCPLFTPCPIHPLTNSTILFSAVPFYNSSPAFACWLTFRHACSF